MDRSMYFSFGSMLFGVAGILSAVLFQNISYFIGGILLAIIIFAVSPQKTKTRKTQ